MTSHWLIAPTSDYPDDSFSPWPAHRRMNGIMKTFPSLLSVELLESNETGSGGFERDAAEDVFHEGHLWTEELIDGDPLRFRVTDAGFLEFGDGEEVFEHDAVPLRYRTAVRAVREGFARDAFVSAVEDPSSVTFFGVATHARGVPYDLDRLPSFLGTALHDIDRERYLPPDTVRRAFERVGLPAIDPIEKELRAAHVDPETYPIPESRWYDGPAAGVVFHNKNGGRAVRQNPTLADDELGSDATEGFEMTDPDRSAAHDLADRVPDAWLDQLLEGSDGNLDTGVGVDPDSVAVDRAVERALERLARETSAFTTAVDGPSEADIRSALAGRIDRYRRS